MKRNETMKDKIKLVQKSLMAQLFLYISLSAIAVVAYEAELLLPGGMASDSTLQYNILMVMELLTICSIPLALKLFSFKNVKLSLENSGADALKKYGSVRISIIGLPLLLNTILYYQFMAVAFAYMAIIGLICIVFVYPSMGRCLNEINIEK